MKKLLSYIITLTLLLTSPVLATVSDGTFTGAGNGRNGEVKVDVTFADGAITDVVVSEHEETPGVADPALETIPGLIVESQSVEVDSVAGASMTSDAIKAAVSEAILAAGGAVEDFAGAAEGEEEAPAEEPGELVVREAPIIIVGAGGAGLAAAVKLGQLGQTGAILVEKMPQAGGNTARSGAAYNAVDPELQEKQGIEDSIELHIQQTYEGGDEVGDIDLITVLCENALDSIHWLQDLGIEFQPSVTAVIGAMYPRSHYPLNSVGSDFTIPLEQIAKDMGQEIVLNMRATEFIVEDGRVVGVKAEDMNTGTSYEFRAEKGVILTTGGFGADVERCRQYNPNIPADIRTSNQPGATGDGIDMAVAIGAALEGIEYVQMLPIAGNFVSTAIENQIFVNDNGERFVREDGRRDVMSNAVLEQEGQHMHMICDARVAKDSITGTNIEKALEAGQIFRADTLEELAEIIGVNGENLVKSVEEFNKEITEGAEDPFGREVFDHTIEEPPFYSSGVQVPILHHTMGGVKIDTLARVISEEGEPIPGLYAAGEVCGGVHGGNRLGGNALADIFVFGRIAAESCFEGK